MLAATANNIINFLQEKEVESTKQKGKRRKNPHMPKPEARKQYPCDFFGEPRTVE
jgi:hypothetical protein